MKPSRFIPFLFFCFSVFFSNAQDYPVLKFENLIHDFGTIKEEDGKVKTTFYFTNTGSDTLKISDVKPACGCTTANWTKTPLLPGQKGFVEAEYNPKNRPGSFSKAIVVYSNATERIILLNISGYVTGKEKTVLDTFPVRYGNLLMRSNEISFLGIKNDQSKTDTLEIYNYWNKPMTLSLKETPPYITCRFVPQVLQPLTKGMIILTYDASKKNDYGLVSDYLQIITNDTALAAKELTVTANICEDFSTMTAEQIRNAPKIKFTNESYDFGTVKEGDIIKFSFVFKNEGNSKLIIRKTRASCGCIIPTPKKTVLKKNKSSKINVEFKTEGKPGTQHKTITVILNSPDRPTITLSILGKVIPK